ncbi:fimbrillin family protein [Parabacteroides sp.]
MKTLVLSMISIAATVAAMTACTSESDPVDEIVNPKDAKVEIKLNAGVVDVTTKAADPTDSADKTKFAANTKVKLLRWDITGTTPTLDWSQVKEVNATAGANDITFDEPQYYPTNGDHTYFMGLYPAPDEVNILLNKENGSIEFKELDGKTDILNARLTDAGDKTNTTPKNIQFKHILSQININLTGNETAQKTFGDIKKITLTNIPCDITLTLGTAAPSVTPGNTTKDLTVMESAEGEALTAEGKNYPVMITPSLGSGEANKIVIKIETTVYDSTNPLEVEVKDITEGTQSGVANKINLTFKDKISVTTGISPWENNTQDSNHEIENK